MIGTTARAVWAEEKGRGMGNVCWGCTGILKPLLFPKSDSEAVEAARGAKRWWDGCRARQWAQDALGAAD